MCTASINHRSVELVVVFWNIYVQVRKTSLLSIGLPRPAHITLVVAILLILPIQIQGFKSCICAFQYLSLVKFIYQRLFRSFLRLASPIRILKPVRIQAPDCQLLLLSHSYFIISIPWICTVFTGQCSYTGF